MEIINNKKFTEDEKKILLLLKKKNRCLYGNIFKELNISQTKGAETILSLTNKGYIKNVERTSFYQLNVEIVV
ncbi:MAG: hypothetical protein JW717_07690 [Marinilabiliaceae bacterium]|nr:hypothetical protein [Marinilabiliaceae bacterium]